MLGLKGVLTTGLLLVGQTGGWPWRGNHWVDIWATMPQLTEEWNLPPEGFTTPEGVLEDSTVRSTIYITQPADKIRLVISNQFGGSDLPITQVTAAKPVNGSAGVSAVEPSTVTDVTFSGSASIIIPNGAEVFSDPIDMKVNAQTNLAISVYLASGQAGNEVSSHPGSRTTSYFARGNYVDAAEFPSASTNGTAAEVASAQHWYFISAVEGWLSAAASACVVVGDSITDGRGSTPDGNNRWPDQLLARMQKHRATRDIAMINQAAGGNRILADGLGPNALGRIDRDVVAQPGVKYAIIFEGVNDFGVAPSDAASQEEIGDRLIEAYEQMITRLHRVGIAVFGGTITPCSGPGQSYGEGAREETRQRLNEWIRTAGKFDGVIDFDEAVRDPDEPTQLLPEYDDGDYLHLSPEGYKAMAEAVDLGLFLKFEDGPQSEFTK